jgi:hypothetical protein
MIESTSSEILKLRVDLNIKPEIISRLEEVMTRHRKRDRDLNYQPGRVHTVISN